MTRETPNAFYPLLIIFALSFLFSLMLFGGCTAQRKFLNSDFIPNSSAFLERSATLRPGMTKEAFFKIILDLDQSKPPPSLPEIEHMTELKYEYMSPTDIWPHIYGGYQPQPITMSLEELQRKKWEIMAPFEGIRFPYAAVRKLISLAKGIGYKERLEGGDIQVVVIFENGRLWRARNEGFPNVAETNEVYIWDLISGASDGLKTGAVQGIKHGAF